MRQELAVQLEEFLEKGELSCHVFDSCFNCFQAECSSFVDTLFTVIRTKSYMPYSATPSSPSSFPSKPLDNGIPIPLDALMTSSSSDRIRKRSDADDERDGRPPAKGPRLNNDTQFSRYGNGGGDGHMGPQSSGGWSRPHGDRFRDGGGMGMGIGAYAGQLAAMGMNGMNGMVGMGGMMNGRRPQGYQPPDQKRGICRDYHS
jgi:RNA-binding protein 26